MLAVLMRQRVRQADRLPAARAGLGGLGVHDIASAATITYVRLTPGWVGRSGPAAQAVTIEEGYRLPTIRRAGVRP